MRATLSTLALTLLLGCQAAPTPRTAEPAPPPNPGVGILVMAHGGGPAWDRAVDAAIGPVRAAAPTAVAFGMADRTALQVGLDSLAARGVRRVAVVRLFLSGRSFRAETLALLGLGEPVAGHGGHAVTAVDHGMQVATHEPGLLDSPLAAEVIVERAVASRPAPRPTSLLLVAHGMGNDDDDGAVLRAMERSAAALHRHGFARVGRVTLREDWPDKRLEAEDRMRTFVREEARAGHSVLVVPVRLFGFGPYAEVLQGLEYEHTDALLPHPLVARWILETANEIACREGWTALTTACPA